MKPFISQEKILKKLEAIKQKRMPELLKEFKEAKKEFEKYPDCRWAKRKYNRIKREMMGFNCAGGIPFKTRKGIFEGSTSYGGNYGRPRTEPTVSHGFDPVTGRAHSYEWYDLGKIIKGHYVVNSYSYSSTTRYHYYALCNTLKILGVKFTEIEAPQGLQNLESSLQHYMHRIGEQTVSMKYGQKDNVKWRLRNIKDAEKMIERLKSFGVKVPKEMRAIAIEEAEQERAAKIAAKVADRENAIICAYYRALESNDLQGVVEFHKINKNRVKRGLPELQAPKLGV